MSYKCPNCGSSSYQKDGEVYVCSHCQAGSLNAGTDKFSHPTKKNIPANNAFPDSGNQAIKKQKSVIVLAVVVMLLAMGMGVFMYLAKAGTK
jgi:uncharacterized Zn finger protein (UPF0148 family)